MPQFMTIHRAPGLLKETWVEMSPAVYAAKKARMIQAHVDMAAGFIFTIYEAENKDDLIEQFEELGFPYDEIHDLHFSQSFAELEGMLRQMGKL